MITIYADVNKYPYIKDICQNFHIINAFMEATIDWILSNQQIPKTLPDLLYDVILALSEVVFHSGGGHMTSHNKHHGGLHVVWAEWYRNADNFIKRKNMSGTILYGLSMPSSTTLSIRLQCIFLFL